MDFADPQLIARVQAFEKATESLTGEYSNIAENWAAFTAAGEALAEMSPHAALIHNWYHQADEGTAFPDGEEAHDGAWLELWFAYFDFRASILSSAPSWVTQAHAHEKLMDSLGDIRSWFPAWDINHGVWKS